MPDENIDFFDIVENVKPTMQVLPVENGEGKLLVRLGVEFIIDGKDLAKFMMLNLVKLFAKKT